jgi:hypothetical protein
VVTVLLRRRRYCDDDDDDVPLRLDPAGGPHPLPLSLTRRSSDDSSPEADRFKRRRPRVSLRLRLPEAPRWRRTSSPSAAGRARGRAVRSPDTDDLPCSDHELLGPELLPHRRHELPCGDSARAVCKAARLQGGPRGRAHG